MQLISDLRRIDFHMNLCRPQSMLLMEPCPHAQLEAISRFFRHKGHVLHC